MLFPIECCHTHEVIYNGYFMSSIVLPICRLTDTYISCRLQMAKSIMSGHVGIFASNNNCHKSHRYRPNAEKVLSSCDGNQTPPHHVVRSLLLT